MCFSWYNRRGSTWAPVRQRTSKSLQPSAPSAGHTLQWRLNVEIKFSLNPSFDSISFSSIDASSLRTTTWPLWWRWLSASQTNRCTGRPVRLSATGWSTTQNTVQCGSSMSAMGWKTAPETETRKGSALARCCQSKYQTNWWMNNFMCKRRHQQ